VIHVQHRALRALKQHRVPGIHLLLHQPGSIDNPRPQARAHRKIFLRDLRSVWRPVASQGFECRLLFSNRGFHQTAELIRIQQIAGTARELVDSMSDIVWAINPKHDRLENLLHRMRRFAEETLGARNIDLHFETVTAESSLRTPPEIRRQVFLVFKEAIANVAKHSGATSAKVGLTLEGDWLHIAVRDNGCGFDPTIDSDGNGLINMRRRVEATGGTFQLESAPRGGTRILASVALKAGRVREPLSFGRGA